MTSDAKLGDFWGWIAVLGRFIGSFVYMGTSKALGVLIPHLVEQLNSTEGAIGMCSSLFAGLPHFAGPASTILVNKYGVRPVMMLGGLLSSVFIFSAAISTTEIQLGISLALAGLSNGICILSCIIPLAWYFPDRFALVNGISASGGAIGMMLLPPITEMLLELYGWRGTIALLAALNLHCVLSGAMVKRPPSLVYKRVNESDISSTTVSPNNERHSVKDVCSYISNVVKPYIFQIYPSFAEYQFVFLIFGTVLAAWVLFLVPDSVSKGISSRNAAFLSTIGGIGHLLGRLIQGFLIDWGLITGLQLFGVMSLTCAISFLADPWITGYLLLSISAFNVGFATGVQYTLSLSITKTIVTDSDLLLAAMGWTHLFIGIGKLSGGPMVGYIHDATGAYIVSFITLGALEVVSIIILLQRELKTRFST